MPRSSYMTNTSGTRTPEAIAISSTTLRSLRSAGSAVSGLTRRAPTMRATATPPCERRADVERAHKNDQRRGGGGRARTTTAARARSCSCGKPARARNRPKPRPPPRRARKGAPSCGSSAGRPPGCSKKFMRALARAEPGNRRRGRHHTRSVSAVLNTPSALAASMQALITAELERRQGGAGARAHHRPSWCPAAPSASSSRASAARRPSWRTPRPGPDCSRAS